MLRSICVGPDVPAVSTTPGSYSVTAEKSSPFSGKFETVFAVNVALRVGSLVFRIGGAPDTFTVVVAVPTCSFTFSVGVSTASSETPAASPC